MGSVQHLQPPALQTLHVFNTQALTSLRKTLVTGMFTLERDFVVFLAGSHKLLGSICTLNISAQPSHWHFSWHVIYFTKLNFWTNAFPWVSSASLNSVDFSPTQMHCRWRFGLWPTYKPLNIKYTKVCSQPCGPPWALWGSSATLQEWGGEEVMKWLLAGGALKKNPKFRKVSWNFAKIENRAKILPAWQFTDMLYEDRTELIYFKKFNPFFSQVLHKLMYTYWVV